MRRFTDTLTLNSDEVACLLSLVAKEHNGFVLVEVRSHVRPINQRISGDLFDVSATWERRPLTVAGHPIYQSIFKATKDA